MPLSSRALPRSAFLLSSALVIGFLSGTAQAQTTPAAKTETTAEASDWSIAVGPAVYVSPKYPGAKSSFVFPWIDQEIEYKHRFFSKGMDFAGVYLANDDTCLLYTSPSPRDPKTSRMPSSA